MLKRSIVIIFLVLMAAAFSVRAQNDAPKAVLIMKLESAPEGQAMAVLAQYFQELINAPRSRGRIILYGRPRAIARSEKLIRDRMAIRRLDSSRLEIVDGGYRREFRHEFWIVPPGAEMPVPGPAARVFAEIALPGETALGGAFGRFFAELEKDPTAEGMIVNYGTAAQIARRERALRNGMNFRVYESPRLTFVNGGRSPQSKTVFWIVPAGAERPQP